MRLVVFGWGNDARGDDGLGPLLLARVAGAGLARRDHASRISSCRSSTRSISTAPRRLCFSTPAEDTPAPFAFSEVAPCRGETFTTHAIAPEAVLDVYARSLGKTPPPSFTLCVRGERFELGEGLSAEAAQRLEAAWDFLADLMRERTVEAWRRAARPAPRGASRTASCPVALKSGQRPDISKD